MFFDNSSAIKVLEPAIKFNKEQWEDFIPEFNPTSVKTKVDEITTETQAGFLDVLTHEKNPIIEYEFGFTAAVNNIAYVSIYKNKHESKYLAHVECKDFHHKDGIGQVVISKENPTTKDFEVGIADALIIALKKYHKNIEDKQTLPYVKHCPYVRYIVPEKESTTGKP